MKSLLLYNQKPMVMGILNVTPDSFSDGGKYLQAEKAVKHAMRMIKEGADIVDIGGQSTGPGSKNVSVGEELKRVLPVLKKLRSKTKILISVDTWRAEVADKALECGADMINDVTALRGDKKMASVLAKYGKPVILMYSKDKTARTSMRNVHYDDVVKTVKDFLKKQIAVAARAGIERKNLILDPGMGAFVSSEAKYSLQILARLKEFQTFGLPILVGASRKSFIGQTLNLPLSERLEGSLACAAVAALHGASILRAHDVKQTRRIVDMIYAVKNAY